MLQKASIIGTAYRIRCLKNKTRQCCPPKSSHVVKITTISNINLTRFSFNCISLDIKLLGSTYKPALLFLFTTSLCPEDFNPQKQILFIHIAPLPHQTPALNFHKAFLQGLFICTVYLICVAFMFSSYPNPFLLKTSVTFFNLNLPVKIFSVVSAVCSVDFQLSPLGVTGLHNSTFTFNTFFKLETAPSEE